MHDLVSLAGALEAAGARALCLLDGAGPAAAGDDGGLGRYSYLGCDPDDEVVLADVDAGGADAALARLDRMVDVPEGGPMTMGLLGYDFGRAFERIPAPRRAHGTPDLAFFRYPAVLRVDHTTGEARFLGPAAAAFAARVAALPPFAPPPPRVGGLAWNLRPDQYRAAIHRVLEYLRAGDAYQVNYTARLHADVGPGPRSELYRLLRAAAAPLGAYIALGDAAILSTSPELFLRVGADRRVETRPIKGTRARGVSVVSDAAEMSALVADPKERAEHLMIVDLERSDLGRVCEVGSVHVEGYGRVVTLPTLHHVVSTVAGTLRAEVRPSALLRATFPCGSITGAPKVRAMQIISELEPDTRGVYTGAIGYFAGPRLELSVAIRTAVIEGGRLTFGVGGGIVVDSDPAREWAECELKASGLARALEPTP